MKRSSVVKTVAALAFSVFLSSPCFAGGNAVTTNENMGAILKLETIKENYLAGLRAEAVQTNNDTARIKGTGPASAWLQKVQPNQVNMVTNRLEKTAQSEIKINGKSYFASNDGAAWNISQNPSIRFAKDPLTGKTVDKAAALIFADASGRVYYFESEASFKKFLSLAIPETVFGYSEPK